MKEMIFTIDGRDLEAYQLTNRQMVDIIKGDKRPISDERDYLMQKVLIRFERECCPRKEENESYDNLFVRQFSSFMNGRCNSKKEVARAMANEHRHLQNEMFKLFMEFVKVLAENYENHLFDARNEWACMVAFRIQGFIETL